MARVAIVGGGLAGFVAYLTLRRGGVEDVTVFAPEPDPAASWRRRAAAIRQTHMRSESDGHCLPTSFPGLAVRDARARRSVVPLVRSVCDRYHPTVEDFLAHVEEQRVASGWSDSVVPARVTRVSAVDGAFELRADLQPGCSPCDAPHHLRFEHVLLATGHPALAVPDELTGDPRAVHSYEPHEYAESVCVVGAGLAAATEWRNALAAGSRVISVRRREPVRRPLNVPRPYLTRRGLASFHRTPADRRAELLRDLLAPSYPPGREWDAPLADARFSVEARVNGADQVVCATGFREGCAHDALLRTLVEEHSLETVGGRLVLAPDSTVASLTDASRTLAVAGVAAQWAYPAADTLMGARYAAHGFLEACRTR
jgi:cation diffusion facilitator CzcD-associated flavoprotein CzcO